MSWFFGDTHITQSLDSVEIKVIAGVAVGILVLVIANGALRLHNKFLKAKMESAARREVNLNSIQQVKKKLLLKQMSYNGLCILLNATSRRKSEPINTISRNKRPAVTKRARDREKKHTREVVKNNCSGSRNHSIDRHFRLDIASRAVLNI